MSLPPPPAVTPLAQPIDLSTAWNATDDDISRSVHPAYARAIARLPEGSAVFRGLPFSLGTRAAGRRWILVDGPIDLAIPAAVPGLGPVSHVVVAHFADSWRDDDGDRPPGMPIGWVAQAGEPLAEYTLRFADGTEQAIAIRRRFQIADGIIGWGFLPFEAIGHRADEPLDWRGPYPRQSAGRYPAPGHAGLLGMLPGAWGPAQTAVADFVPTPDDDITLWLHAIPIRTGAIPRAIHLAPLAAGRAGSVTVVAALTLFAGTADPLVTTPRRQLRFDGPGTEPPELDLGVSIRTLPAVEPIAAAPARSGQVIGWGRPRPPAPDVPVSTISAVPGPRIVDIVAAPDARLGVTGGTVAVADLDRSGTVAVGRTIIRALPPSSVRVDIRIRTDGAITPARIRFVSADGRYLAPLGHRDEVNPALLEDTGADVLLGGDAYAYLAGDGRIDLPQGPLDVEIVKGFEHRPARLRVDVGPATREISVDLDRAIDLDAGWRSGDPHVHFLAPSTALVQAAAEDVALVHLLATQAGDLVTNAQDLVWGSISDPTGRHAVVVGTENRQNLLGHVTLLGARAPVLPMAAGGAPEGRLGGAVTELLVDWADRCHEAGGLVVGAHFPLPYAEMAAAIALGRIDAIEMQTFAPRLDSPSIHEWYRFLNCGFRLPILGGTDKMSAEVPVGAIRTYARVDATESRPAEGWAAAVRAGRTFATSGPILDLTVDGHEPGDLIRMPAGGGRVEVLARARAAQPIVDAVEIVLNGRVVAREEAAVSASVLEVATAIDVDAGSWIAARSLSEHQVHSAFTTAMAAHTSPVYVEVADHPIGSPEDAEMIATIIDGSARWIETMAAIADTATRARMVETISAAARSLRRGAANGVGGTS